MGCGCSDPAASGGCCTLAETLTEGNDAGGLPISGVGAPSGLEYAARLGDLSTLLVYRLGLFQSSTDGEMPLPGKLVLAGFGYSTALGPAGGQTRLVVPVAGRYLIGATGSAENPAGVASSAAFTIGASIFGEVCSQNNSYAPPASGMNIALIGGADLEAGEELFIASFKDFTGWNLQGRFFVMKTGPVY